MRWSRGGGAPLPVPRGSPGQGDRRGHRPPPVALHERGRHRHDHHCQHHHQHHQHHHDHLRRAIIKSVEEERFGPTAAHIPEHLWARAAPHRAGGALGCGSSEFLLAGATACCPSLDTKEGTRTTQSSVGILHNTHSTHTNTTHHKHHTHHTAAPARPQAVGCEQGTRADRRWLWQP